MKEKKTFLVLGLSFLVLQLLIVLIKYDPLRYDLFFWFCNHSPLFFGIAFLLNKKDVIKALINAGFIGQFVWILDLLSKLVFDIYLFNLTQYVFETPDVSWVTITIISHVLATNIALYFTYKSEPKRIILLYSFIYLILLYIITLSFTPIDRNVNCVYEVCGLTGLTFPFYFIFWPIAAFIVMVLPVYGLQNLLYNFSKRKKS